MGRKEKRKEMEILARCMVELAEKETTLSQFSKLLDIFSHIQINEIKSRDVQRSNALRIRRTWDIVGRNIKEAMAQYGQR